MNKEEWHKYFIENKDKFTSSRADAEMNNKIYVAQCWEYDSIRNQNLRYRMEFQERGDLLEWMGYV